MIVKGLVQCPHCAISIQAYFQRNASSLLCPNCQVEIGTNRVTRAQTIALACARKRGILRWFCMEWLQVRHILRRDRLGTVY